ncbi:MAG: sigma-70 family RNA polymerase sigma factor [Actinomycetota bacterium]|nr:sigma-70 family RNA polymerase sigma factor [Actinomycetota bacterium]
MANGNFRERPEQELIGLSDDELIDYIRRARAAGRVDAMTDALRILVFGYQGIVERRVALKVPREDIEEVADAALESAFGAAFSGESVGEFRSWLNRITSRRIADYWRRREGKPELDPLPSEHEGDDAVWGAIASVEFEGTAIAAQRAVDQALSEISEAHRHVVEGFIFEDRPAAEVADEQGTSVDNVHQIASRFRKRVRELLDDGDTPT